MNKKNTMKKYYCHSSDGSIVYSTDTNFIYAKKDGKEVRLDLFDTHYYKLRVYNNIPILEIDGLRMQLVKNFATPLEYAEEVVKGLQLAPKNKAAVLDTCMGLGYTAIAASKHSGVDLVVTCEISEAVLTLAKWNPFSEPLFQNNGKIRIMHGSIVDLIKHFDSETFSYIIHDPPRFSHAPELYSSEFYQELYRVCKKGGCLFHYVGSVGKKKGRHIDNEVMKRLSDSNFKRIKYVEKLQGIFAER